MRGPHRVGVATVEVLDREDPQRQLPIDVWYPAAAAADGEPADHPLNRPHDALESPTPAEGRFPLIAFSHGNSGLRRQSTFLTTHLASWGFTVVAPDHTGNTFLEMARLSDDDERIRVHREARRNRPGDLTLAIDVALAGDGPWAEPDADAVAALGHSFGGWTALKMPRRDPRVRAVCGLAPASEPFVGRKAFEPDELPLEREVPALLVAGIDDVLVDLATSVEPLFRRLGSPRALVGVDETDHFHFCDGVELLHGLHVANHRPNQPRPAKAYADQLAEERIHRILCGLVTRFFFGALVAGESDPCNGLGGDELQDLDPALRRLDDGAVGTAA